MTFAARPLLNLGSGGSGSLTVSLPASMAGRDWQYNNSTATSRLWVYTGGSWELTGNEEDSAGTWLVSGSAADAEIRFTVVTGSLSFGTTGTWLALSTTRSWGCQAFAGGVKNCTGTLQIRDKNTLVVLATSSVSISARSWPGQPP